MSEEQDKRREREAKIESTRPRPSPERTFPKPAETDSRPGFVDNDQGTSWSGMIRGNEIVNNGGETYGDTDIDPTKGDTRDRIEQAKAPVKDKDFYGSNLSDMVIIMDQFARGLHRPDVVGSYFPAVKKVQAEQKALVNEGTSRVLSDEQRQAIADLRESQVAQNTANWSRRDEQGVVEDEAVIAIEGTNEVTSLGVLEIEKQAASEVLGDRAAEIEAAARTGVEGLSDLDTERRVVTALMEEAGKAKLTPEETTKLEELKVEEDRLWDEKHDNQTDFADAIRDGNPDCSEYASMTAVSLAESGINNVRVMGHVLHDSDYASVGAHAYNVILDESGENIVGVFEGTATSGAFKQVMNGVSLAEFEAGATLVTYNEESGWSTYGTGAPAQGRNLMDFVDDPDRPGEKTFVENIIERRDMDAIGEAKMEYAQNVNPEMVADQIIEMYAQYGDDMKVQAWIDDIRDGRYPSDDGHPAFAQAAQIMQDYSGPMPPPAQIRDRIMEIVADSQDRALASDNYDLAITPEILQRLDGPASNSLGADLKDVINRLDSIPADQLTDKPWLTEVKALSDQIGDVPFAYSRDSKTAFDYSEEGDSSYYDAYMQLASIVRQHDITREDLQDLQQSTPQQTASIESTLGLGAP